ncbi:hypothetical protein CRG98_011372 [Punica granatum]|uniref:Uncharacterized protein n=1 Tax=Punica granatum TaxID=22663 RepID=A0A2I0KKD3_PUNGR|nr:hypothetical protein CRG98_011372 [Punica granatum]
MDSESGKWLISSLRRLLVEDAPVLLLGRLLALTEADLIIVAVSGQSAEAVAVASLGLVIGFFVWSSCSLLSLEVDLPVEAIACWGCPSVAFVAVACKKELLRRMLFSFGSSQRPVKSFVLAMRLGSCFRRPLCEASGGKLLWAMHGHIETFSMTSQRLYWLFDASIDLGPFSSRCHRAATSVTCWGFLLRFGQT